MPPTPPNSARPRPAASIDEVVEALDGILEDAQVRGSRLGYFPALYRKVTVAVRQGIADGVFEDGERLARLDVLFANRYLEAYAAWGRGERPSASWQVAFEAAESRMPIVLQHLLLGINAHINLDLGIAAEATAPGAELPALRSDFLKINEVLASLVDGVKAELAVVWPKLRTLERLAGGKDDRILDFSLTRAREHAWSLAEALSTADADMRAVCIARADRRVAKLGRLVRRPGPLARFATWWVRLGERGTVREILEVLR